MAGWHHWLYGPESEWTPRVGDGQGGLACCDSWGHKENRTRLSNWTELNWVLQTCFTSQILPATRNLPPRSKDLQRCLAHSLGTTVLDHILGVSCCFFHVQRTLSLYKYWPPSEYQTLFWVLEMQTRIKQCPCPLRACILVGGDR